MVRDKPDSDSTSRQLSWRSGHNLPCLVTWRCDLCPTTLCPFHRILKGFCARHSCEESFMIHALSLCVPGLHRSFKFIHMSSVWCISLILLFLFILVYMRIHARIHACVDSYTHKHAHTHTHAHTHILPPICIHTYTQI